MHTDGTAFEEQPNGRQDEHPRGWRMVRPDMHDPAGIVADFSGKAARQRERELMIALLEDAFHCYRKYAFSGTRRGRRIFQEAERWFMELDTEAAITFQYVCDILGIEPDSVRRSLGRWRSQAAAGQTEDVKPCDGDPVSVREHGAT